MTNEELKVFRDQLGLTQYEMADRLRMSHRTYQEHEQRTRVIPGPMAVAIESFAHEYGRYAHVLIRLDGTVEEMAGHAMDKYTTELALKMATRRVQIWREFDELEIRKRLSADILAQRMAEYEKLRGE